MRLRFLLSFHYYRNQDIDKLVERFGGSERVRLFADSGAFSVKTNDAQIDLDEYADWIIRWQHHFAAYASLDVIGDAAASWTNLRRLEDRGLAPLPVFHAGEEWSYLEEYLAAGYRYIGLGNIAGGPGERMGWLIRCFQLAQGRAVYHGFGMTNWSVIRDLPFYSVDSSSWGSGHRYGTVTLFDRGRWIRVGVGTREPYRYGALVRAHGEDPKNIAESDRYHYSTAIRISARAWQRAAVWLHQRHGDILLPGDEAGPHIYHVQEKYEQGRIFARTMAEPGPHVYHALAGPKAGSERQFTQAMRDDAGPHLYITDGHADHLVRASEAME